MLSANVEKQILDVLVGQMHCVDEQELNILAKIIMSPVRPATEGDVGRSYQTKLNNAATHWGMRLRRLKLQKVPLLTWTNWLERHCPVS